MPEPLSISHQLRDALHDADISVVHWKSNSHLAEALAGRTDMDLFVDPHQERHFSGVMEKIGGLRISSQPWARYPGIEDWLVFDAPTGNNLHLHVHYRLLTGLKRVKHLELPWKETLLARLRHDPASGWPVPTAEMELLMLLVRIWAKMPPWRRLFSPKLPAHLRREISLLVNEAKPLVLAELLQQLGLRRGDANLPRLFETPSDEAVVISIGRDLYGQLRPHFRMSWSNSLARAALLSGRLIFTRMWLRIAPLVRHGKTLPRGGALIAIIGADGSGKSTLTADLESWLRFKLDAHRLYMGSGSGAAGWVQAVRRAISAFIRRAKPVAPGAIGQGARKYSLAEKLYRLVDLRLMYRKLRLLRRGRKMAQEGSLILLDRYPQHQVHAINDGPRLQDGRGFTWAAEQEKRLYREAAELGPDLVIRLRIDPATALLRKPDHDPVAVARKCRIVDELNFSRSSVVTIDANREYACVLREAKQAIWNFLLKHSS